MLKFIGALLLAIFLVQPNISIAQDGFGRFDYTGKKQNRPTQSNQLFHPSGSDVICFSLPGNSCSSRRFCRHSTDV